MNEAMKRFLKRCRITWHSYWFRYYAAHPDDQKLTKHFRALQACHKS